MALEIAEWSEIDAANDFIPPEGAPEGMKRSYVNDTIRGMMGTLARDFHSREWLDLTVGAGVTRIDSSNLKVLSGDYTASFTVGRRIKLVGGIVDPFYAHVVSSVQNAGDTDVELDEFSDLAGVPVEDTTLAVTLHSGATLRSSAFTGSTQFVEVSILTSVALQAAIDSLEAGDGGILLLSPDATYVCSEQVDIGKGVSDGVIRIIGRNATLMADDALDDSVLTIDGSAVWIDDLRFDGNSANQTGTADTGLVELLASAGSVRFHGCYFDDSYGHLLKAYSANDQVWFSECEFHNAGEDGVSILDPTSDAHGVFLRDCSFSAPASRTGVTVGACLRVAGSVRVTACEFLSLDDASAEQIGVVISEKKAASPSDQSGHDISVVGCHFVGTGLNSRGVDLEGRDSVVSGCGFDLSGNASVGVNIGQPYAGETSSGHAVTGNRFRGCGAQGVNIDDDSELNTVVGNVFYDCETGIRVDGENTVVSGNSVSGGVTAISVQANSSRVLVVGNLADGQSNDAIVLAAGCSQASVCSNSIVDAGADGIAIASGAIDYHVSGNNFRGTIGEDISDASLLGQVESNKGLPGLNVMEQFSSDETGYSSETETFVDGFRVNVPTSADGVAQFEIEASLYFGVTGGSGSDWVGSLRAGTNADGDVTLDTLVWSDTQTSGSFSVYGFLAAFDAGDELYWTIKRVGGSETCSLLGNGTHYESHIYIRAAG